MLSDQTILACETSAYPAAARAAAVSDEDRHASPTQSLKAINGLRGPGALAIAFAHLGVASDVVAIHHIEPIALLVDLFFVLSGLVIAQAYAEKLSRPAAIPEYVIRRFGRIWPVQAATLLVLVFYEFGKLVLQWTIGRHFSSPPFDPAGINIVSAIPTNLLLIQSLGIHDRETWNFPSWSLSVELVTYVLFAVFCLVRPRLRHLLAGLTIVISVAILIFVAPYHMRSTFDYGIFRCLSGFFAGTMCQEVIARRRLAWPMPTLVEIAAVILVCVWLACSVGTYAAFAAPFVFSVFVLAFAGGRGRLSALLSTKLLQKFADWSFAVYMVHALVLIFFLAGLHALQRWSGQDVFTFVRNPIADHPGARTMIEVIDLKGVLPITGIVLLYGAGVLAAAWAAHRLVEVPGRTFFSHLARRVGKSSKPHQNVAKKHTAMEPTP